MRRRSRPSRSGSGCGFPSYRNFLQVSDGWEDIGFVDLLRAGEIGWFADLDADLLEAWSGPDMDHFEDELAVLRRCLLIGHDNGGSGCYWLLHADSVRGRRVDRVRVVARRR
ncbi:hypothetical protein NKH77_31985 [Streptomyces sp. M19]